MIEGEVRVWKYVLDAKLKVGVEWKGVNGCRHVQWV